MRADNGNGGDFVLNCTDENCVLINEDIQETHINYSLPGNSEEDEDEDDEQDDVLLINSEISNCNELVLQFFNLIHKTELIRFPEKEKHPPEWI
ncbi:MAG: hypothetical protein GC181_11975 [Bacteroidetes bacterium]|nr:hypothetical protein [Bacteroidota bacterium]